jgi:hypothetical protein
VIGILTAKTIHAKDFKTEQQLRMDRPHTWRKCHVECHMRKHSAFPFYLTNTQKSCPSSYSPEHCYDSANKQNKWALCGKYAPHIRPDKIKSILSGGLEGRPKMGTYGMNCASTSQNSEIAPRVSTKVTDEGIRFRDGRGVHGRRVSFDALCF